jgi:heme/copper-type cytochrome/quinol oxidase subunit 4
MSDSATFAWHRYIGGLAGVMGLWLSVFPVLFALDQGAPGKFATSDYAMLAIPFTFGIGLVALSLFLVRRRTWARSATVWLLLAWLAVESVHVALFMYYSSASVHSGIVLMIGIGHSIVPVLLLLLLRKRPVIEHFRQPRSTVSKCVFE